MGYIQNMYVMRNIYYSSKNKFLISEIIYSGWVLSLFSGWVRHAEGKDPGPRCFSGATPVASSAERVAELPLLWVADWYF